MCCAPQTMNTFKMAKGDQERLCLLVKMFFSWLAGIYFPIFCPQKSQVTQNDPCMDIISLNVHLK
uniref:Uncharacterized protein n=1 Tax=Anguilla anguilla TaxID=7936 RepID=A0A0E9WP75_ANGAN